MNAHHHIDFCNTTLTIQYILKMEALLSIVEPKQEVEIDQDKLKYMVSQKSIWGFFGITSSQYSLLSSDEKTAMLKKYYIKNLSTFYGNGKLLFFV